MQRPKPTGYPKELKTIGDHIRAWRMGKGLLQKDVAYLVEVYEDTVTGWEMRGTIPLIEYMPSIIKMLGYLPVEIDTSTLAGKVKLYRYTHGISSPKLATMIGIDKSTIFHPEKGTYAPQQRTVKLLEELLDGMF